MKDRIVAFVHAHRILLAFLVGGLLLLPGIGALGAAVSQRDAAGEPVVLAPSLVEAQRFEQAEAMLYGRLSAVRGDVRSALDERQALLSRSARLERAFRALQDVRAEAGRLRPPLAYQTRKEALLAAVEAHWELAVRAARWLNEPSEENRRRVLEALCGLEKGAPECLALTPTPTLTPTPAKRK